MTDTTTNEATDVKRPSVAKHELIAAPGGEHVAITEALGIRYTDKATGNKFEYLLSLPQKALDAGLTPADFAGSSIAMLALFGGKTKATNEASRVRNGKDGTVDEEFEALDEVFANIDKGVWRDKAEGGGGSRTDKRLVAQVLIGLLGEKAQGTIDTYQHRLETEEAYFKKVWSNDDVKAGYRKAKGNAGAPLDALA